MATGVIVGVIVVVLLVCGGVGYAIYHFANKAVDAVGDMAQGVTGSFKGVDDALAAVNTHKWPEGSNGVKWLISAQVDPAKRDDVLKVLREEMKSSDGFYRKDACDAYLHWVTKDQLPELCKYAEDPPEGLDTNKLFDMLAGWKDPRAIAPMGKHFWDPHGPAARMALAAMGPMAEKEVLKNLNHPDGGARAEAVKILNSFNTKLDARLAQSIEDLKSPDANRHRAAYEWFTKTPFDSKQAEQVAKAMAGSDAEKEALKNLNSSDNGARIESGRALKAFGTKIDAMITQSLDDLKAADPVRQKNACDWLAKMPLDPKRQADVAKGLGELITDPTGKNQEPAVLALGTWATADNVPALVRLLDEDFRQKDKVLDALVKLKDPRGYEAIAKKLDVGNERKRASQYLEKIGQPAEDAVATVLGATADGITRTEAIKLLGRIGTMKSIPVIEKAMMADTKSLPLKNAGNAALAEIKKRGK
jgi:hypothetical protein